MKQTPRQKIARCVKSPEATSTKAMDQRQNGQRPLQKTAILVVDDEPGVAAVLVDVLSEDGYLVDTAADGEEALEKLRQHAFDVIVCDIRMPKMNGLALYRVIAQEEPCLLSRMIFLTGDTLNLTTQAFLQQAAAPALEKPFALGKLRELVRQILRTSEPR
jgi:CheY-like chemotaxis protein